MRAFAKTCTVLVVACLATLVLAALILPRSFFLTAVSDVVQCFLLLSGTASVIPHATRSRGRLRLFWLLIGAGVAFWFAYQLFWTYFEVCLRQSVPDIFVGDIVLFLHIVPLMAALALRPHAPEQEYAANLRRLDFAMMLVWWVYLYVLMVIPWQYVVANSVAYNRNLNSLYLVEKLAFLSALLFAWERSRRGWRTFYANLIGASLTYALSSYVANIALSRHTYYSGSVYDIPLATSMAWLALICLWTNARKSEGSERSVSPSHGVWLARLGMIAAFSLPLFAAWALIDTAIPPGIRLFRVVVTLGAAFLMGLMVFLRHRLLDRELLHLLTQSRESIANLKRLQAQITESEKLASVGQLVGGVAHELNNPITAMLGYSDLLLCSSLNAEQKELAGKISQHARRTRSLVASLLNFAKQRAPAMAPVDLNALLRTAVKLSQTQWQALKIEMRTEFAQELLLVHGDSNQLLQVCIQIIDEALHAVQQPSRRCLTIVCERRDGLATINIFDSSSPRSSRESEAANPVSSFNEEDLALSGLGLSACQGILQQHQGRISFHRSPDGGSSIRVEIPLIPPLAERSTEPGVPVLWQPQPSA